MKSLPVKPTIQITDLDKIDIRVGTITKVEDLPQSDKLVRMTVDFGDFTRHIMAGLKKERQDPKEIEGKQSLFVVNLASKVMFGEQSEGMLFDIGFLNEIIPVLAIPEKEIPNGSCAG
jgi:methionine--tRNA ligase beta chain